MDSSAYPKPSQPRAGKSTSLAIRIGCRHVMTGVAKVSFLIDFLATLWCPQIIQHVISLPGGQRYKTAKPKNTKRVFNVSFLFEHWTAAEEDTSQQTSEEGALSQRSIQWLGNKASAKKATVGTTKGGTKKVKQDAFASRDTSETRRNGDVGEEPTNSPGKGSEVLRRAV